MTSDAIAPKEHNLPPQERALTTDAAALEALRVDVLEENAEVLATLQERIKAFEAVPAVITTAEDAGKADDLFKMMRRAKSRADEARKTATEPYRMRADLINAIFEKPMSTIADLQKELKARVQIYMDAKATRERVEREARAAREREEAQRKLDEAAAAERERVQREKDAQDARDRERKAREEKEEAERVAAQLKAQAKKQVEDAAERARLQAAAEAEKARARELRKTERAARDEATEATEDAERLEVETQVEFAGAEKATARADKADRAAQASPADLSRTRSDLGSVGSLTRSWKVISVDTTRVDLSRLRGYFHPDAIGAAAQRYMMDHRFDAGGPKLEGCVFEQVEDVSVR
jgi:hypothetical protein